MPPSKKLPASAQPLPKTSICHSVNTRLCRGRPRSIYNHCGCQTSPSRKAVALCPTNTPILIAVAIVLLYILNSIKILKEYERAVIFRLGRVRHDASGPGIILVFRPIDQIVRVSLRQEAMEVPSQDIITRDNVTLKVNAVIIMRVVDPVKAVIEVSNYVYQTSQFAQTTLRSRARRSRSGRAAGPPRPPQPAHSGHHRRAHRALRPQGRLRSR